MARSQKEADPDFFREVIRAIQGRKNPMDRYYIEKLELLVADSAKRQAALPAAVPRPPGAQRSAEGSAWGSCMKLWSRVR